MMARASNPAIKPTTIIEMIPTVPASFREGAKRIMPPGKGSRTKSMFTPGGRPPRHRIGHRVRESPEAGGDELPSRSGGGRLELSLVDQDLPVDGHGRRGDEADEVP